MAKGNLGSIAMSLMNHPDFGSVVHNAPVARGASGSKDVYLGLQTFAQTHIHSTYLEPAARSLVEVQAPADLDDPAVVESNLSVMQIGVDIDFQLYVLLQQALAQLIKLVVHVGQQRGVVEASEQRDLAQCSRLQDCLTEPYKILDLMRQTDVGIFHLNRFRALQVRPHDGLVGVTRVSVQDSEVLFGERWLRIPVRKHQRFRFKGATCSDSNPPANPVQNRHPVVSAQIT